MATIMQGLSIKCKPDQIYAALTTTEGLSEWWTQYAQAELTTSSYAEFRFDDEGYCKMLVKMLEPNKLVKWTCVDGPQEWLETEVVFDLTEQAGSTWLKFDHTGWEATSDL